MRNLYACAVTAHKTNITRLLKFIFYPMINESLTWFFIQNQIQWDANNNIFYFTSKAINFILMCVKYQVKIIRLCLFDWIANKINILWIHSEKVWYYCVVTLFLLLTSVWYQHPTAINWSFHFISYEFLDWRFIVKHFIEEKPLIFYWSLDMNVQ